MPKSFKTTSILVKLFLKIAFVIIFFATLLIGFFLLIKQNHYGTPVQRWQKLNEPSFNLVKYFGFKWNIIIFLTLFIGGFLYRYPIWKLYEYHLERQKLVEFAKTVHMAVISADVGKGKTLLLSILANSLPHGRKKVGFVSNVPDAELLSYNDINFHEPISQKDNYRLNKYFFLDETNFWIDGVEFQNNRKYHKGVAFLLQIIRHHKTRLWISATRENHVWVAVREIVNYYVKLGGVKHLMDAFGNSFYTLRVQFYSQSWELIKEFNPLIPDWDFELYDSYWLAGTASFRQILEEKNTEYFQPKWQELSPEEKEWEEEAERQLKGKSPEIMLQLIKNNLGKDFLPNFYNSLNSQKTANINEKEVIQTLPEKEITQPKMITAKNNEERKLKKENSKPLKKNGKKRESPLSRFFKEFAK